MNIHNFAFSRRLSTYIGLSDTSHDLFDAEMKYLHDNGFKVYTMANIRYNHCIQSLPSDHLGLTPEYQFLHYYDVKQYI